MKKDVSSETSSPLRGRPRNQEADAQILKAALNLVERIGFKALSMEAIAEQAGVARTTIYRRWPNKATVVMDAFLLDIGPEIEFPKSSSPIESLRTQMSLLARAFRGRRGVLVRSLLAEAQFNAELKKAFLERWILKRRATAKVVIAQAIAAKELAFDIDGDVLLDALYGGLYYWLLIGTAPPAEKYIEALWNMVVKPKKHTR